MQFRDLKKQYQVLKPQMDEAVIKVMSDCNFISGDQVKELEARLAEYVGVKHCITCANGTDALTLAETALGIGTGDAVFVPDFTFFATAETPAALGATPVFVDVLEETFNMDPVSLEEKIRLVQAEGKLNLKAVIAVDLFGLCADYPAIRKITDKYGMAIIEDGAQGFGGRIGEKKACSFGDISTTSFFPAKPLGCYGDGGAIFTDDDEKAAHIRSLCVHGKGADKYDNVRLGLNSRLDTVQAAVLGVKLSAFIDHELDDVNTVAALYTEKLAGSYVTPMIPEGYYSSWAQYTLRMDSREQRDALQAKLKADEIPSMVYYPKGMGQQAAFDDVPRYGDCPISTRLCSTVLQLPIHPYLQADEIELITALLQ